jgi:hypothetical protein
LPVEFVGGAFVRRHPRQAPLFQAVAHGYDCGARDKSEKDD